VAYTHRLTDATPDLRRFSVPTDRDYSRVLLAGHFKRQTTRTAVNPTAADGMVLCDAVSGLMGTLINWASLPPAMRAAAWG